MGLREGDEDAIERIPVQGWKGGRGARDAGIKSNLAQIVLLDEAQKPLDRRLLQPELASGNLNRHLPWTDDRHAGLRRLP